MKEEDEVVTSPLSRAINQDGKRVQICIYRGTLDGDTWICEVIDSDGHPSVSNEMYATDQAALEAAISNLSSARRVSNAG